MNELENDYVYFYSSFGEDDMDNNQTKNANDWDYIFSNCEQMVSNVRRFYNHFAIPAKIPKNECTKTTKWRTEGF